MTLHSRLILVALLALGPFAHASTWYVDGVHGSDTDDCTTRQTACKTIGHAISLASSGDSILVGPATYKEHLFIEFSLGILGANAKTTIIDGSSNGVPVQSFFRSADVTLSELTIQNGYSQIGGGGIENAGSLTLSSSIVTENKAQAFCSEFGCSGGQGGGIYNSGTLTINNSTLRGNEALGSAFRIHAIFGAGGGVYNLGSLTVSNSTVSGNHALDGGSGGASGGGIVNGGALVVNNSTLTANYAESSKRSEGGGIYSTSTSPIISNNTFSGNSAALGGNIYGSMVLQNTIVAHSAAGGNCYGTMTSVGYNLSSDNTCNFSGPGDLNNTDPTLGPLQNNGGPTQTMALLPGSPAIDAGNPNGCTDGKGNHLTTDQRGAPRPDKHSGICDIGAYEFQSPSPTAR